MSSIASLAPSTETVLTARSVAAKVQRQVAPRAARAIHLYHIVDNPRRLGTYLFDKESRLSAMLSALLVHGGGRSPGGVSRLVTPAPASR